MASLKSLTTIVLLLCLSDLPGSAAQDTQWPEWPQPGQDARSATEDARRLAMGCSPDRFSICFDVLWPERDEQEEARRQAALLAAAEKNYREMTEAATELAAFSQKISDEIDVNGPRVVSKLMLKDLERLEKLAKKVRNRGKRLPRK